MKKTQLKLMTKQNIKDLDSLPFLDRESFKASDYYIHLTLNLMHYS